MQNIIIGRKEQINQLKRALASPRPEMVALIGRRRVGKTYLVKEIYKDEIVFEVTGLQYGNKAEQIQNLLIAIGQHFPDFPLQENFPFKEKPKDWLTAFFLLSRAIESANFTEKKVIFLDEIPWMGTSRSKFIMGLGWFWNSWASRKNVVVVICGSAASWMIKKVINDRGGLHNRVTKLLYLYPFTLAETEAYCKYLNVRLDRYQLLQIYMTMGGIPLYLQQLQPGLSAIQNIQKICFDRTGYLRNEFERLYASLFNNHEKHIAVIRALATKRIGLTRQEIIKLTKFKNGGGLTKILNELQKSDFIKIYGGFGKRKKDSLYRLTDFYSLFYLTYIERIAENDETDFTQMSDLPQWKIWGGYAFENVCLMHVSQIRKALGISGVSTITSSFIARPKDGLPGAQIDLVIDRRDQTINLCEIKFSGDDYELTRSEAEKLRKRKSVFRYHTKTKKHLFTTLITTFGVVDNAARLNYVDQIVVMDDLFASDG